MISSGSSCSEHDSSFQGPLEEFIQGGSLDTPPHQYQNNRQSSSSPAEFFQSIADKRRELAEIAEQKRQKCLRILQLKDILGQNVSFALYNDVDFGFCPYLLEEMFESEALIEARQDDDVETD